MVRRTWLVQLDPRINVSVAGEDDNFVGVFLDLDDDRNFEGTIGVDEVEKIAVYRRLHQLHDSSRPKRRRLRTIVLKVLSLVTKLFVSLVANAKGGR